MTLIQKSMILFILLAGLGGFAWIYAQDQDPNTSSQSSDKWIQIQENNKEMIESLDEIEKNLNFIKARSMSGGRSS